MAIDLMGSRFYMQQMKGRASKIEKVPTRLKKDIVADIESTMSLTLPSLMNITKPTLEAIYDSINIH